MNGTKSASRSLPVPGFAPGSSAARDQSPWLQAWTDRLLGALSRRRDVFFLVGDATVVVTSTVLFTRLVQSGASFDPGRSMALGGLAGVLIILANLTFGNYRLAWVTFSLSDLKRLFGATVLTALALAVLGHLPPFAALVPPNPVLWGMVLFLALATFRGSRRLLMEPVSAHTRGKRTLIVISSKQAYFVPNILRRLGGFRHRIVGIVDPDRNKVGDYEQGIQVVGTTGDIEALVEKYRIAAVIVMLENNPGFGLGDFYTRLHRIGRVEVRTMPSLVDVLEDRSDLGALEKLCIHELTGRPPIAIDVNEMRRVFSGKRVMVTGAGGSIGSELCRQLAKFDPERLVLLERDDSNLFYIDRELRSSYPALDVVPFLGDITHARDLEQVFTRYRPEVIFHAAAYKHVPILEFHPEDAVRVNVLGAHLLAKMAVRHGAECFVYVSTDKAVNPTSTMGASKRLGEMLTTSMNGLGDMRTMAVRFGNVLDSRGSVSTIFRDAIAKRKPLTVTHEEMKRYFMLTSEATLLVLQAAALGKGGEVFVLDMGEPVRIWDLAHRMVELAGLTPNVDIPIMVSGIRPGEKLFEELLTAEEGTVATENDRIYRARISRSHCYPDLIGQVQQFDQTFSLRDPLAVKRKLAELVGSYQPDLCTGLKPSCHLAVAETTSDQSKHLQVA